MGDLSEWQVIVGEMVWGGGVKAAVASRHVAAALTARRGEDGM